MHTRAYEAWSIRMGIWLQRAHAALDRAVWAPTADRSRSGPEPAIR